MKKCSKCLVFKREGEFYRKKTSGDGLQNECKVCDRKRIESYQKTKLGVVSRIYGQQKQRSKKNGWPPPSFSKTELSERLFGEPNFHKNFAIWEVDGFKNPLLKPSFDRKDDYKPYTFENLLRICSWGENKERLYRDMENGINNKKSKAVIQTDLEGNFIKEFYSASQAERETGVYQGSIGGCCRENRPTAGGFMWKFA